MAEYDLTGIVSKYLDKHLIIPLLEFLSVKNIYDADSLSRARYELLLKTNMIDSIKNCYCIVHNSEDVPAYLNERREAVVKRIQDVEKMTAPAKEIFKKEVMEEFSHCQVNKEFLLNLEAKSGFKPEMIDDMFIAAQVFFDSGLYGHCSNYLYIVRQLLPITDKRHLQACWGLLASDILLQDWDAGMEDLERLKDAISGQHEEKSSANAYLVQLEQRTWMLHWALYVFFNRIDGREKLIEWFLQSQVLLNAIQTLAPHLLRYLVVCVVISTDKKKKTLLRELTHLIQQETYAYRDPVTEFVECLYVKFDFDGAQEKLKLCETVLPNDFFLTGCDEDFIKYARMLMFETFCRIHHSVGIDMLAEKLNMTADEAEGWIVDLLRNARMDAKIDSKKGRIIMGTQLISPYQQVVERTRNSGLSASNLLKKLQEKLDVNLFVM